MKSIKDISILNKTLFIRVDFNVPMDELQNITDDIRIRTVLPTLSYALDHNAKIIIASHMGRPNGSVDPKLSLGPVAKRLSRFIEKEVTMAPDCVGPDVKKIVSEMKAGDIVLLENLRFHKEEQENDEKFSMELASYCDVYVNNAFAVSHREHASVTGITNHAKQSVAGFLLQKEVNFFKKAMNKPMRPLVAVLGGAKVSSKLGAIENMLCHVDKIIIGGAMANTFLKCFGYGMGKSFIENDLIETAQKILKKAAEKNIFIYLPVDAVVAQEISAKAECKIVPIQEIPETWMSLDIGPATSLLYKEALDNAKTIIWNGPMGVFELDAYSRGTISMVNTVANSYAMTVVGGGDTDVAVHKAGESDRITYISTGGGAFLYLMEGKTLPAIRSLNAVEERLNGNGEL
jgi:phosphoglycerate kinase